MRCGKRIPTTLARKRARSGCIRNEISESDKQSIVVQIASDRQIRNEQTQKLDAVKEAKDIWKGGMAQKDVARMWATWYIGHYPNAGPVDGACSLSMCKSKEKSLGIYDDSSLYPNTQNPGRSSPTDKC